MRATGGTLVFKANPITLRRLLAGQYHYRLPRFQRHYAWTEKVVTRLFEDLQMARAEKSQSGGPRSTFLGAIIVIQSNTQGAADRLLGRRQFDIIDGQQRLITLTIMLCVIRDRLSGNQRRAIQRAIAGSNPAEIPYRLTLRKVDEELFTQIAKEDSATKTNPKVDMNSDTSRNMITNRDLLRDFLTNIDESDDDDLYMFANYLLDSCQIALIEADHHDDANQIYEALNHSGLPLQLSNHIKTLAFRGTNETDETYNALATQWDEWERKLTIRRFNRLFSILRSLHTNSSKPIAMENQKIIADAGGCKPYLQNIVAPAVSGYLRILDAAAGKGDENQEIRKYLTYLNWLRDTDWIGPVIKWFQVVPANEEQTIEFLRRLDRLAFALLILSTSVADRAARFKLVLDGIDKDGIDTPNAGLDLTKAEQSAVLYRLSNDFQRKGGRACKLALVRVSDVLGGTLTRDIPPDLTVEHTLPRTVNNKEVWTKNFSSNAEMNLCFKRFANMVLLPKRINERLKNQSFEVKVQRIFYSRADGQKRLTQYALTNHLAECENWDAATINSREEELFEIITEMWDLKGKFGRATDKTKPSGKPTARRSKK